MSPPPCTCPQCLLVQSVKSASWPGRQMESNGSWLDGHRIQKDKNITRVPPLPLYNMEGSGIVSPALAGYSRENMDRRGRRPFRAAALPQVLTLEMNVLKEFGRLLINEPSNETLKQWSPHAPQRKVFQQLVREAQAQESCREGGVLGKVIFPAASKLILAPGQTVPTLPIQACIPLEGIEIQIEPSFSEQLPLGFLVSRTLVIVRDGNVPVHCINLEDQDITVLPKYKVARIVSMPEEIVPSQTVQQGDPWTVTLNSSSPPEPQHIQDGRLVLE
ncbi:unnamed protein product [Ranitomeya imitator]|uniref:Uncharacterized protein n=1 Tax=Ranitomeya imitator TaxID=111125 RepID=A0ABN9LL99_9NEOB|nr:unnamed protein product [Ranitomeya imitator]